MLKNNLICCLILFLTVQQAMCGESAKDTLQIHMDKVISVLKDSSLAGSVGKKTKVEKIGDITEQAFDFTELSKRSLGRAWNNFNPAQQTEFVSIYKKLIKNTYGDRIVSNNNEAIQFGKERVLSANVTEVETSIKTDTADVSINYNYRMMQKEGVWRVYDVVIEGISLLYIYRTQFQELLAKNTPAGLIEILKKKVE